MLEYSKATVKRHLLSACKRCLYADSKNPRQWQMVIVSSAGKRATWFEKLRGEENSPPKSVFQLVRPQVGEQHGEFPIRSLCPSLPHAKIVRPSTYIAHYLPSSLCQRYGTSLSKTLARLSILTSWNTGPWCISNYLERIRPLLRRAAGERSSEEIKSYSLAFPIRHVGQSSFQPAT